MELQNDSDDVEQQYSSNSSSVERNHALDKVLTQTAGTLGMLSKVVSDVATRAGQIITIFEK